MQEKNAIDFSIPYGTLYSGGDKSMLDKHVKDSARLWQEYADNVPAYVLDGTIGTHIGLGAVGIALFEK